MARARLELLARIGELNELELDPATRLDALLDSMLPEIADACAIFLIEQNELRLVGARHVDAGQAPALANPSLRGPFALDSAHPAARAVRTLAPVLVTRADEGMSAPLRTLHIGSLLTVPLVRRDDVVGALALVFDTKRRPYGPDDVTFALELARRVTGSLATAQRHEQERMVAETLQQSLLPRDLPRVTGLDIAGRYLGATRGIFVGGDWYDVVECDDGCVAVAIGDVVGHGLSAANAMGRLRAGLHLCLIDGLGPADALERLNRYAFSFGDSEMATVQVGMVDPGTRRFRFASAGHPPPVVVTPTGAVLLEGGLGIPLATSEDATYDETEVELDEDALVLLYTDGLVERRGESLTVGLDRLVCSVPALVPQLDDALDQLLELMLPDEGAEDDVALVAVRLTPFRFSLATRAVPGSLFDLRAQLRRWLGTVGAAPPDINDITVAVNEAAANSIEHAQQPHDDRLRIEGDVDGSDVHISVIDSGSWRPVRASDDRGRGVHLMRELMDEVVVTRGSIDAPGTTVRLQFRLSPPPGD